MTRSLIVAAALLGVTALVLWLARSTGRSLSSTDDYGSLIYSLMILVVVLTSVVLRWRGTITEAASYTAIWAALFLALVLGYSYRDDFKSAWARVAGELNPAQAQERASGELVLRKADDGHFYADVEINGKLIRMLADTGATTITLSQTDARAVGIDLDALTYNVTVMTANGPASAAGTTIGEIRIGTIVRRNVRAGVSRTTDASLLGMSFFTTLSRFEMRGDKLILVD